MQHVEQGERETVDKEESVEREDDIASTRGRNGAVIAADGGGVEYHEETCESHGRHVKIDAHVVLPYAEDGSDDHEDKGANVVGQNK